MENYSPVERRMVTMYDTIEGRYRIDRDFILSVTFLILLYLKDY